MGSIKVSALTCFVFGIAFLGLCTFETTKAEVRKKYGCVLPEEPWYGSFVFNDRKKSLKYKCDDGYILSGSVRQKQRKCRRGKWSGKDRDCLNLDFSGSRCPALRNPNNGEVIVEGRGVGDKAHFMCNTGFVLEGSKTVTCQKGRRWDGTMPICSSRRTVEDFANHLKDKMIDSLAGATVDSEAGGAQSRLSPGKSGLDIVLVVDTSSSIGHKSLASAKKFMKLLVDLFGVSNETTGGTNGTRFALVTFSSEAKIEFNLDNKTARSKNAVKASIDAIQNTGGGTDFRNALMKVNSIYLHKIEEGENKARVEQATRAVFLITDAEVTSSLKDDRMVRIKSAADLVKIESGFEIFAIGVGQNIDKFVLSEIASTPHVEHVFILSQFKDLEKVGDIIAERNIDYGQCGISGKTEIRQGSQTAEKGAWPWLGWLSVASTRPRTCGGAILCNRWFLTAASCVSRMEDNVIKPFNASQINVFLSDHKIYAKDDEEKWPIVYDVLIHDNYTGEEIGTSGVRANDVALLDLGENATMRPIFDKFLRPICFPTDNTSLGIADAQLQAMLSFPTMHDGYTAGWGNAPDNIDYMDIQFSKLMQNRRPVQKNKNCKKRYPDLDLDRFFCVGDEFQESKNCMGDIGGPYMIQLSNKRYSGVGLALSTRGCDIRYKFSIFLNLLHPTVNDWVGSILDGCNRVEEIDA